MYLCSSDVLPTFMSPKSTIFPSGFLIFPKEGPRLLLSVPVRPVCPGSRWSSWPPPPDRSDPGLARTRTRGNPDSRGPGLARTPNLRRPAGVLPLRRLGGRERSHVSEPGQERGTQPGAHLRLPDRCSAHPSGSPRIPPRPRPQATPRGHSPLGHVHAPPGPAPDPAPALAAPPRPRPPRWTADSGPAGGAGAGRGLGVARAARRRRSGARGAAPPRRCPAAPPAEGRSPRRAGPLICGCANVATGQGS